MTLSKEVNLVAFSPSLTSLLLVFRCAICMTGKMLICTCFYRFHVFKKLTNVVSVVQNLTLFGGYPQYLL